MPFQDRNAAGWTLYRNIKYGSTDQETADFYILNNGVHPAVVFIHGGAWQTGDKSAYGGRYARLYLNAGFDVITINYRLASDSDPTKQWNAPLQDAQEAIRFIRDASGLLRIDPDRIAAAGDSAGAHLALFLGSLDTCAPKLGDAADRCSLASSRSSKVNAVLDMFGPVDLPKAKAFDRLALLGGRSRKEAPDLYKKASPIFSINRASAPTCIVQGLHDRLVPPSQSYELRHALKANHVANQLITYKGGHVFEGLNQFEQEEIDLRGPSVFEQHTTSRASEYSLIAAETHEQRPHQCPCCRSRFLTSSVFRITVAPNIQTRAGVLTNLPLRGKVVFARSEMWPSSFDSNKSGACQPSPKAWRLCMFERYPIHILIEDQRANLGIRRSELVRRCGFRNVAKGIRRLDALCGGYIGTLSAKAVLAALPAVLGLEAREVEKAVAETADLISRAREQEEAKREAAWRASFKPSAYLVGTRSRPSSITIYGFGGGAERWLTIPLDLSQPPVTYAPQALAVVRRVPQVPFFGATKGVMPIDCKTTFLPESIYFVAAPVKIAVI